MNTPAKPAITPIQATQPFWERMPHLLLYPLSGPAPLTIFVISLCFLSGRLPGLVGLILYGLCSMAMLNYAFECLINTANGFDEPPEGTPKVDDRLGRMQLKLLLMVFLILVVSASFSLPFMYFVLGTFAMALPGMVMTLAVEQNMWQALNPVMWLKIMDRIGGGYWLAAVLTGLSLLASDFLAGMMGIFLPGILAVPVSAMVGGYTIVLSYHLIGYLLRQYADELGYEADDAPVKLSNVRSDPDQDILDEATALQAEGASDQAKALLKNRLEKRGGTPAVHDLYRAMLKTDNDVSALAAHAQNYVAVLLAQNNPDEACKIVDECMTCNAAFTLDNEETLTALATLAAKRNQPALVVKSLNGFHKRFPKSKSIAANYLLVADAMLVHYKQPARALDILRFLQSTLAPDHPTRVEVDKLADFAQSQVQGV
jgi:hypothetical protein